MAKLKKRSKAIIALVTVIAVIGITALGFYIHFLTAHNLKIWSPDYEKIDISDILNRPAGTLSESDYETLYRQTGLTKIGVDRALSYGDYGKNRIKNIQTCYFKQHELKTYLFAPYVCTDFIEEDVYTGYFEPGDIIVTSSTHIAGFRVGHAGLVVDIRGGLNADILQASQIGATSAIGAASDFTDRCNFMIFRPNPELISSEAVAQVCNYAKTELLGLSYFPAAGVLSDKNNPSLTQCAHIVWSAYSKFGYDLDSNAGLVVTPYDLSHSPYLELVQVFGFDPQQLWS